MFRLLCNCAVVALVFAAFAGVDAKATEGDVEQISAANTQPEGPQVEIDQSKKDKPGPATTETEKVQLPNAQELVRAIFERLGTTGEKQLADQSKKPMVKLIEFGGMSWLELADACAELGLKKLPETKYEYSDTVPAGCVISQEPAAGTEVEEDAVVTVVRAQKKIAIEPFRYQLDVAGQVMSGQRIVHRPFDVQLGPLGDHRVRQVPMFSIASDGEHTNLAETDYDLLEARAVSIAKNLLMAWNLMDDGAKLMVVPDQSEDVEAWHVRGPFGPQYPASGDSGGSDEGSTKQLVQINVVHGSTSLRVMTVYPEDASLYGSPRYSGEKGRPSDRGRLSPQEAAEYIVALMEVHHLLFSKEDMSFEAFTRLEIDRVRVSEILQNVRKKAEMLASTGQPVSENLRRALADYAMKDEADLLYSFARVVPDDWRIREEYGK